MGNEDHRFWRGEKNRLMATPATTAATRAHGWLGISSDGLFQARNPGSHQIVC